MYRKSRTTWSCALKLAYGCRLFPSPLNEFKIRKEFSEWIYWWGHRECPVSILISISKWYCSGLFESVLFSAVGRLEKTSNVSVEYFIWARRQRTRVNIRAICDEYHIRWEMMHIMICRIWLAAIRAGTLKTESFLIGNVGPTAILIDHDNIISPKMVVRMSSKGSIDCSASIIWCLGRSVVTHTLHALCHNWLEPHSLPPSSTGSPS